MWDVNDDMKERTTVRISRSILTFPSRYMILHEFELSIIQTCILLHPQILAIIDQYLQLMAYSSERLCSLSFVLVLAEQCKMMRIQKFSPPLQ